MGFYEIIKDGISIAQKADNIELLRTLLEVQKGALELQEENQSLKKEVLKLQEIINDKNSMEIKNECYYFNGIGPYCTRCYDVDNKKVHMQAFNNAGIKGFQCTHCKNSYITEYPELTAENDYSFGTFN